VFEIDSRPVAPERTGTSMPEAKAALGTLLIVERPLCARCISESGITSTDIVAYVKNTAGVFTLEANVDRCPRCGRPGKVFSLLPRGLAE